MKYRHHYIYHIGKGQLGIKDHSTTTQKSGEEAIPKPKERNIRDVVLLKTIAVKDNLNPDSTTPLGAPAETNILKCSILTRYPELFKKYSEERLLHAEMGYGSKSRNISIQRPLQMIKPTRQVYASFLQGSADVLLNKILKLSNQESCSIHPKNLPFTPTPKMSSTSKQCMVVTTAMVHHSLKEVLMYQLPTQDPSLANIVSPR